MVTSLERSTSNSRQSAQSPGQLVKNVAATFLQLYSCTLPQRRAHTFTQHSANVANTLWKRRFVSWETIELENGVVSWALSSCDITFSGSKFLMTTQNRSLTRLTWRLYKDLKIAIQKVGYCYTYCSIEPVQGSCLLNCDSRAHGPVPQLSEQPLWRLVYTIGMWSSGLLAVLSAG